MEICQKNRCTGCQACKNICARQCIQLQEDAFGFLYPHIQSEACVNCGLCQKVCPANNTPVLQEPQAVYAAINKSEEDYKTATSGGIATLLARNVLASGGAVCGAAFEKEGRLRHMLAGSANSTEQFKGSKYIQSDIADSFCDIREALKQGQEVLFIGTPCQVAGLKKFIGENEKLFTCDIVCHGVPAQRLLAEHLQAQGIEDFDDIRFRDKHGFYLTVLRNAKTIYRKRNYRDIFYLGFLKGLFYRACCYSCPYATDSRVGDITLGDFWGFDKSKGSFPVSTANGLSLVMVNTKQGRRLFDRCKEGMVFMEREKQEAVLGNKQLRQPSEKHKNYEKFKKAYHKQGFEKSAKKALWKERMIYYLLDKAGQ